MVAGRTLREVCAAQERIRTFANEQDRFGDWAGDVFEVGVAARSKRDKGKKRA